MESPQTVCPRCRQQVPTHEHRVNACHAAMLRARVSLDAHRAETRRLIEQHGPAIRRYRLEGYEARSVAYTTASRAFARAFKQAQAVDVSFPYGAHPPEVFCRGA